MSSVIADLSSDATFSQGFPHDVFAELRDRAPLYWHEPTAQTPDGEGFWVVSRYADVAAVARDASLFSSQTAGALRTAGGTGIKDERAAGVALNMTDDPRHRQLRSLVNQGFTPKAVAALTTRLEAQFAALLPTNREPFNVMETLASQLPLQTICTVLGVPAADRDQLLAWVDESLHADSDSIMARAPLRAIRDYARALVAEKRRHATDDIFSTVVNARLDEAGTMLSEAEAVAFFTLLFPAGAETTRSALGGAVAAFAQFPEQFARLRADPVGLRRSAVEEIVRWTTPSIYKRRTAVADTHLHGQVIRAGDKVTFWEMSANRDERFFAEPFRFDVGRWPNRHLGFGAGVHFCLGASLARLELGIAVTALAKQFRSFEITAPPRWTPNNRLLGYAALEVSATPAR